MKVIVITGASDGIGAEMARLAARHRDRAALVLAAGSVDKLETVAAACRDIVTSAKGRLGRWMKLIAPRMVDRMALKALNTQGT